MRGSSGLKLGDVGAEGMVLDIGDVGL